MDWLVAEADAWETLERIVWGHEHERRACPHCGCDRAYFIEPEGGLARATNTGSPTARRVWKCRACRMQFSVITGSALHGTKVLIGKWLACAEHLSQGHITSRALGARLDCDQGTANRMTRRLAEDDAVTVALREHFAEVSAEC